MQTRVTTAALVVAALAISGWVAARAPSGIDYFSGVHTARPQIDALARLDVARFVHEQSPLGPVSLVLRAPFAAVVGVGDQLARYRLGSFPCVLALALAGLATAAAIRRRGSPLWHAALVLAIFVGAPPMRQALVWGHPEELLTTALIVVAALAAAARRPGAAVTLAALAIATKPLAALALLPIALMAGRDVLRTAALAAGVAVLLTVPLAVADAHAFRTAVSSANDFGGAKPMSLWWRTSTHRVSVPIGAGEMRSVRTPKLSNAVRSGARPLIFLAALLVTLLAARAGPVSLERGFMILALVFLLRCLLDPGDHTYYHVPFLACLAAAEGLRGRPPLMALAASALLSTPALRAVGSDLDAINLLYLAWAIPLTGLLAWSVLRPRAAS